MDNESKRPRGRPKGYRAENPASERLIVRVTEDQLDSYRAAADTAGTSLSDWVRSTLDKAARLLKK
tara:strand:+ start:561 stop:758 length:198 start_codon:yes stop_codon:yes gene_type:complete